MKRFKNDVKLIFKGLKEIQSIRSGMLSLIVIRSIFSALSPFVNIYMSALIINGIAQKQTFNYLLYFALITVAINLFIATISSILNHIINLRQSEFDARYEMRLNQKVILLDYATVENPETHRLREKINEIRNMNGGGIWHLFSSFQSLIQNLFTIIFSIALTASLFTTAQSNSTGFVGFLTSQWFPVVLIIVILFNVVISMYSNMAVTKKMYNIMNDIIPFNRIFSYYLGNYISSYHAGKDIRIYNQKGLIHSESMALFDDAYAVLDKLSRNQVKYSMLITISTVLLSTIIYLFVGLKASLGLFGVGAIVQYVGSINQFTSGFTGFMTELTALRANNEAMNIYFDFINLPNKMYQGTLPVEKRSDNEYEIEIKNVSFKYPNTESFALKNVNLKFKIGERIAVVGMNGSGKTTMIKLLCRLYDPTEGEITLNGIDIKKYNYNEYMSMFSVVFQDFKLFSFSLGQNVSASVEYDKANVESCLKEAGFGERLSTMSKGLDTCLYKDFEEDGVEISGGEAQKIALARALYKDAPFIVLDEPTAALDPIAEYEIYSKFNEIVGEKTAIYISHRLSSCHFCDDIAVFNEGELIQRGNHETLLADENGKYFELWNAQAQYYTEN